MTTAKIVEIKREGGQIHVSYSVNVDGKEAGYTLRGASLTNESIKNSIRLQAKEFEKALLVEVLPLGEVDLTPSPGPTQAEIDRDVWLSKYRKWIKIKNTLVDTNILTGNEVPAQNLKNEVQAGFKAAYLDFI